jgi:multiple sugar transport system substrate-binding protein
VKVTVNQIPWPDFQNKVNAEWAAPDTSTSDMYVGDSQWLGTAATGNQYVDLTDWVNTNIPVADMEESALKSYGEYDGKTYGVPCMADALAFAYRKDLFEDAKNKADFKAKYNKDLTIPETWDDFKNIAEFFTKADGSLYGCALFYSKNVDGATMGFEQILWSYGGDFGKINSPEAIAALDFYTSLKKFCPPGAENFYYDESLKSFQEGKVVMAENWFAFFPGLVDKEKNKFLDQTGYFMVPKGPKGQFISLGGQGLSISAHSKKIEEAKKFVAWFSKEETQKKWVALGGLTANKNVAKSDDFKKANPYNEVFAQTVPHLKDFYNTPNYQELLKTSQDGLYSAFSGAKKPQEALDEMAKKYEPLLKP